MSQQFATDALGDANCYFVADGRDFGFAAKEFPNSSDTSDNRLESGCHSQEERRKTLRWSNLKSWRTMFSTSMSKVMLAIKT